MPICLLLAEDHVLVRQGLRVLLEPAGMIVVGEVSDGPDALRLAHGRDEAVALPSPRYHAPASQWQPSPESNVRQTVLRCLTGYVYPLTALAARPTSRAPMPSLPEDSRCTSGLLFCEFKWWLVIPFWYLVAGAKFGCATTTFVERQGVKTPMIVPWILHS
jgi:hypothetical protein